MGLQRVIPVSIMMGTAFGVIIGDFVWLHAPLIQRAEVAMGIGLVTIVTSLTTLLLASTKPIDQRVRTTFINSCALWALGYVKQDPDSGRLLASDQRAWWLKVDAVDSMPALRDAYDAVEASAIVATWVSLKSIVMVCYKYYLLNEASGYDDWSPESPVLVVYDSRQQSPWRILVFADDRPLVLSTIPENSYEVMHVGIPADGVWRTFHRR